MIINRLILKLFLALALAGILTSFGQTQPVARTFTSTFFFGDSLSDTGNLFALTGQPPVPYFKGRYSNGPVYAEQLVPGLQNAVTAAASVRTNLNFAFAGATAVGTTPVPASIPTQLGMFQARGITPAATDLFVLLAGANDILNTIGNPATQNFTSVNAAAEAASVSVTSAVKTLAAAGARKFLVINLPNIAQTPRFTTGSGAPAASLADAGSLTYNVSIRAKLTAAGLPAGTDVTLVNLQSFLNLIVKNPASFGFAVTNQSIVDILAAGGTPGPADGYVFFDGIHPTTRTHTILTGALQEILNPEFVLGTAGTQGTAIVALADLTADTVDARLNQIRSGTNRHGADGFVSYTFQDGGRHFDRYQPSYDANARALTAGFDCKIESNFTVGLAFSVETVNAKVKTNYGLGSFKISGESGTGYAQWKSGATFFEATATYGGQNVRDIARPTSLATFRATGKASGHRYGASVRVGHDFSSSALHVTPFVGVRYTRGSLGSYAESGVTGLNFSYGGQDMRSLAGQIGATADYVFHAGDLPLTFGLTGVYSGDLNNDQRTLSGRLADNLSGWTGVQVDDGNGDSFKVGFHVTGRAGKLWSWTAGLGTEMRSDGKDAVQYSAAIHTGF